MNSEKTIPLNDFITLQRGFDLPKDTRSNGEIPVVASTGITGYHNEVKVRAPGVVIGRSGSIGGGQYITEDFWPLNTTLWVKDFKGHHPRYVYYLLRSIDFNQFNVGTGVPTLNRNHLNSVFVADLGWEYEKRIAEIVGDLDDKIELNRQTNQTLEQIAQAIFKSWFVDFEPVKAKAAALSALSLRERAGVRGQSLAEQAAICAISGKTPEQLAQLDPQTLQQLKTTAALFPDALVDSELGKMPEGWEVKTLEKLSSTMAMGPFGSNIKVETFVDEGVPIINGQQLKGTMLEDGDNKFLTYEHADKLIKSNVYRGDIVITHRGTLGQVSIIPEGSKYERYIVSQSQCYIRPDREVVSPLFMIYYFKSDVGQHELLAHKSQVGVPSIAMPVTNLRKIELLAPSKVVSDKFQYIVADLQRNMSINIDEIYSLQELRDTLLPKLLSGELPINPESPSLQEAI
jgi:type I restriction enzyme S subunit